MLELKSGQVWKYPESKDYYRNHMRFQIISVEEGAVEYVCYWNSNMTLRDPANNHGYVEDFQSRFTEMVQ